MLLQEGYARGCTYLQFSGGWRQHSHISICYWVTYNGRRWQVEDLILRPGIKLSLVNINLKN